MAKKRVWSIVAFKGEPHIVVGVSDDVAHIIKWQNEINKATVTQVMLNSLFGETFKISLNELDQCKVLYEHA